MPLRDVQQSCRPHHLMGLWVIDEALFAGYLETARNVDIIELQAKQAADESAHEEPPYTVSKSGVARVDISGPMTKYPSSYNSLFGGSASLQKQKAIRDAVKDPEVKSIAIVADSPGGTVAGTAELADEVKAAAKVKPVFGVVDDLAASGAYWVMSQTNKIFANRTAKVGSIGTTIRLYDRSGEANAKGVKAVSIDTGKFKTVGMPGKEITEAEKQDLLRQVNQVNEHFVSAVAEGRKLSPEVIKGFEARCYVGKEAQQKGLVDEICSVEEAFDRIQKLTESGPVNIRATKSIAASAVRSHSMSFTDAQMEAIRKSIPGAQNAKAEELDGIVADYSVSLQGKLKKAEEENAALKTQLAEAKAKIPDVCDPKVADGHLRVFEREVSQLLKEEKLMPEQVTIIKAAIHDGDKLKSSLVSIDGTIMLPADQVVKALELNKPKNLTKEGTTAQIQEREPIKTGSDAGEMTPEQKKYDEEMKARIGKRYNKQTASK